MFSNLAIDKPYDQHNAGVNDDGGAVGLTECPATLRKWMFSGPDMTRVIIEFERSVDRTLGRRSGVQKRIWQSIYQTSSFRLVLDTWDVVEKYCHKVNFCEFIYIKL